MTWHGEAQRLAVVGAGVAGLTASYLLRNRYRITVFEAADRLGGHAHTVLQDNGHALETGFMVFNRAHYPFLVRLFDELGVATQPTEMSMSVTCDECGLAYVTGSALRAIPEVEGLSGPRRSRTMSELHSLGALVEQRRFDDADFSTLADVMCDAGVGSDTAEHFVLPLVAALWSCDADSARRYPAAALLAFLANHGMLPGSPATRWRTVVGGSRTYVDRLAAHLTDVRLGVPIAMVRRTGDGFELTDRHGDIHHADRVVIATHAPQALAMLADPTPRQVAVLGALADIDNNVILHTDASVLHKQPSLRASWNFRRRLCGPDRAPVAMHYWLNSLQRLDGSTDFVVTLNDTNEVAEEAVIARMAYAHPRYTPRSARARRWLPTISDDHLAFAGAYHGWGFHEDGCRSGAQAAARMGVTW